MTPVGLAVAAYLLVQFGIGIWASRRISNEEDYLVAGRQLGYPLGIFSIFATWFGAETCIGAAADISDNGLTWTTAEPFGYGLCIILMGLVFAVPLWRRKLTTLADLFRQRYSVSVERLAALFLIPTSLFWAAAQIRAFGHVLSSISTLDVNVAIALAATVAVLYTAIGGMLADAITDMVQGAALIVGLSIVFVATVGHFGGPVEAISVIGKLPRPPRAHVSLLETIEAWSIPILGSVIATELVSRVIATRTPVIAKRSALFAGGLYITVGLIPAFIGLTGAAIVPSLAESEQLLPAVAEALLPTALYAVFVGALVSAILSTVDTTLLISSGLLAHNLIIPSMPNLSERAKVLLTRVTVGTFGIIAYIFAMHSGSVLGLIEQSSAFGSAGILVIVTFGLFSSFGGPVAAFATLLAGMGAYVSGVTMDIETPFVLSIGASLATYVVIAAWETYSGALANDATP